MVIVLDRTSQLNSFLLENVGYNAAHVLPTLTLFDFNINKMSRLFINLIETVTYIFLFIYSNHKKFI